MSLPPLYREISFAELATPADIQAESGSPSQFKNSALLSLNFVKRDLCCTPPIFFVGASEDRCSHAVQLQPPIQSDVIPGYGNRRLSRVLAESVADANEKKLPSIAEVPQNKVNIASIDPDKGIFGNGRICTKSEEEPKTELNLPHIFHQIETMKNTDPTKIRTVRVFGYLPDSIVPVLHYFSRYGEIESYRQSSGNWISITYKKNDYAIAALKSNGAVLLKQGLIGVVLESEEEAATASATVNTSLDGSLGSGVAGPSVRHRDDMSLDMLSRLKEALFGW